ncbi:glycosyltransferase [Flavobacterium sp. ALJ2]|uniref:glycosyltransferase n=1 Tax=Flavobacterium sp. ALJ2 TaxID=2786960 RepID=UPI00189FBEF8|nr:glycosyltransferase [Flavobacterium sp. ALJ2]MBF7091507.1 glycosyltransferase [Flavobacterium sp. ALJ2]
MKTKDPKSKIIFLSTFPPTQCGIATYTEDSINAINKVYGKSIECEICELTDKVANDQKSAYILHPKNKDEYKKTALQINKDNAVKLIHIQHEFGLFGGEYGNYLIDFLNANNKPITFTFHSVIPRPNEKLKNFVKLLISYSSSTFVMTNQSKKNLIEDYGINHENIVCVHHGTHIVEYENTIKAKQKFNLGNRIVLSTFGLLGEGKNIETGLKALPKIVEQFPNVLYLIIGKTHPNNIINNIDEYRNHLESLVNDLNLKKNVLFINQYLEVNELLNYLKATDVYLFTSKDPNQAVSGTFSYAMSCSCPIVATKIPHTIEVLSPDTGILVDIKNAEQFANATIKLLLDPKLRESMALNAFEKTRKTSWENVAIKHIITYQKITDELTAAKFMYPPIKMDHQKNMTTALGMIQFSKISEPDITSGYTLDDNARALISMCLHYQLKEDINDIYYINTYMNFIERCQQPGGSFINYVDEFNTIDPKNDTVNLEDSNARAIWALGMLVSLKSTLIPPSAINKATTCVLKALNWTETVSSPRSIGFIIKGLFLFNTVDPSSRINEIIDKLATRLSKNYNDHAIKNWNWFENYLTYANSILSESMLYAYLATDKLIYKNITIQSFDFLLSKMFINGEFKVISNNGWHHKGAIPYKYGEQPIDVSYTIQTLDLFYKTFNDPLYKKLMKVAFNWFLGQNHLNQIMYDPITGGCYDGLEKENVNLNQGAESTICYLTARLLMEKNIISESNVIKLQSNKDNLVYKLI